MKNNFRKSRLVKFSAVAGTLVAGLTLTACTNGGPSASDSKDDMTNIRVAFNPGTAVQLYAGLANGLFEEQGISLDLMQFENGSAANAAFASGDVDIGYSGIPGIFSSRLASGDTRIFMIDNEGADAGALVAGADSGISSAADLRGRSVGTVIGTTAWMGLLSALEAEGIDENDVDIKNVGPTAWLPALQNKDVDAIWGWAPLIFTMEEAGGSIVATDSEYMKNPLLWQARGEFLDEEPEATVKFITAYQNAAQLVEDKDPAFIEKMMEVTGSDEATVVKTVDALEPVSVEETLSDDSPYSFTDPSGLKSVLQEWLSVLVDHKILDKKPELDEIIDPKPLQTYLKQNS